MLPIEKQTRLVKPHLHIDDHHTLTLVTLQEKQQQALPVLITDLNSLNLFRSSKEICYTKTNNHSVNQH